MLASSQRWLSRISPRQLAQQALQSAIQDPRAGGPHRPTIRARVILNQIGAMQKALKEDEELVIMCRTVRTRSV